MSVEKITTLAKEWFNANRQKNNANNAERKTKEQLQIEVTQHLESIPANLKSNSPFTVEIDDTIELQLGNETWTEEEIDPKKLLEMHPEYFWTIVSVAKGTVINKLGEKEAAKLMRTVTKSAFKIEKIKKPKR
jgi:hypothetical protein